MGQVKHRKLSLREAAEVMALSYRQAKRVWRRYKARAMPGWCMVCVAGPARGAKRRVAGAGFWRATGAGMRILARRWRRSIWQREDGLKVDHDTLRRWLVRRVCGRRGGGGNSIGSGGNARRVWGRWCNWTARITIGLRDAGPRRC